MTPAIVELERLGVDYSVHEYRHEPGSAPYGEEAARALGLDTARVFKTLLVDAGGSHVVAIIPVSMRLDLKLLARLSGCKKLVMAAPGDAERVTGYVVGGISPLGQKRRHRTWLDDSALRFETVFVSGGRRGLELELAPRVLAELCDAGTAPLGLAA
jgi:Cys-tRNA(Pro)/Cys-tRNA(Cys) deacylase